jgi:superfamily I DNA/RNA helicase
MLKAAGIETVMVEKDSEPDNARKGVRIATMHRLKGLEFPRLLIAGIQVGTMPLDFALKNASDEAERSAQELRERCLLYVASTRARDELVITGFGGASPLIRR